MKIQEESKMLKYQKVKYWGCAFVVFKTQGDAEKAIEFFEIDIVKRYAKRYLGMLLPCLNIAYRDDPKHTIIDKRIFVDRAPEPLDIIWKNLARLSKKWWLIRTVSVYVILVLLLIPIFFLISKPILLLCRLHLLKPQNLGWWGCRWW